MTGESEDAGVDPVRIETLEREAGATGLGSENCTDDVPTICVCSARGGVGKTSIAVIMALVAARAGIRTSLIDLDYQFGSCLAFLGAERADGLAVELASDPRCLEDDRALSRCRVQIEPALDAYEFCSLPEHAELLTGMTSELLRAARRGSRLAVVDLPTGLGEGVAQAIELCDRCLLIGDQRALSLESLGAMASLCDRMGVSRARLVTVLNQCDARHRDEGFLARASFEVRTPQVSKVLGGGSEVTHMLSIGCASELLTMRNRFAVSVEELSTSLCIELGCLAATSRGSGRRGVPAQTPGKRRRHRKIADREEIACPF